MIKKILATVAIIGMSFSIDISVPNDYDTIQEAVDAANNGDRIILDAGNYGENVVIENKDIIIGSKYLTTGDDVFILTTRIAGDSDKGASVTFKNTISNDAGLIGLTVNQNLIYGGCWGGLPLMPSLGGAIACVDNASPRIENVEIFGSMANLGAGIAVNDSDPIITGVTIDGTEARNRGGGIYLSNSRFT